MFTIRQNGDVWELLDADGKVLLTRATYDLALGELATMLHELTQLAIVDAEGDADTNDGLLPDVWTADLCFSEDTGDGRDFTDCSWTSRDPNVSTMPLMLQTQNDMGHYGAVLAGYFTEVTLGDAPTGRGRFYDSDAGVQLRDMLLDDRTFGVSVDPGAVEGEFVCTETDDDGWCIDGYVQFMAYEIIGVTATPFPAFARAMIRLDGTAEAVAAAAGAVSAQAGQAAHVDGDAGSAAQGRVAVRERPQLATPPRQWFDDPALLMPTPLTITQEGHVLGHVAAWGTCHVGSDRVCIAPPTSRLNYRRFTHGVDELRNGQPRPGLVCADGSTVQTGALTWGIPHAHLNALMLAAFDHYADSSHGWADVNIGEDDHGIWIAGAIRPHVTADDLRVLRALALSGDWRRDPEVGGLELIAALAVNVPGFPIPTAVVASGMSIEQPSVRASLGAGMEQMSLVASGLVVPTQFAEMTRSRCGCDERQLGRRSLDDAWRHQVTELLKTLDRRTRHLTPAAIEAVRDRLGIEAERVLPPGSYVPRS